MNIKILAIETSQNNCSICINIGDKFTNFNHPGEKQQTEHILPLLKNALTSKNIKLKNFDAVAFSAGPSNFTGIRLAASVAQGLCLAANLPIIPISTLRAMAQNVFEKRTVKNVLVALDSRMQQIYVGVYRADTAGYMQPVCADRCVKLADFKLPKNLDKNCLLVGDAWELVNSEFELSFYPKQTVTAANIAFLARTEFKAGKILKPDAGVPNYLQNNFKKI